MSTRSLDTERIGPELTLSELRLPPHVGERLATLFDRDGRFETGAEWVAAIREASEATEGRPPTVDDLCTMPDGAHSVSLEGDDETTSFVCVLDPLAVPFLEDRPGTVRSTTPEDGEDVTVEIATDDATATPSNAVVSLGVARDVDAETSVSHEGIYREVCPYIHVFASVDEYERWADGVDAATTSVPVDTGIALARELAGALFVHDGET
ncbi:MAG: organomercurial lyase [Haloarculaceae archaeon]